jgi:hypothetical protein
LSSGRSVGGGVFPLGTVGCCCWHNAWRSRGGVGSGGSASNCALSGRLRVRGARVGLVERACVRGVWLSSLFLSSHPSDHRSACPAWQLLRWGFVLSSLFLSSNPFNYGAACRSELTRRGGSTAGPRIGQDNGSTRGAYPALASTMPGARREAPKAHPASEPGPVVSAAALHPNGSSVAAASTAVSPRALAEPGRCAGWLDIHDARNGDEPLATAAVAGEDPRVRPVQQLATLGVVLGVLV